MAATHDEVAKHIHVRFMEEITSACGYLDMAENAEKMGRLDLAEGLCEMAKDEYTHAAFIESVMNDEHITMTDDEKKKYSDLERRIECFF